MAASEADTPQQRKKNMAINLLRELIEQVERENLYGEFSVTFTSQNGSIGHIEQRSQKTFK